jgi:hypothetical protein
MVVSNQMTDSKQSNGQNKSLLQPSLSKQPTGTIHPAIRLDEFPWMKHSSQQQPSTIGK